MAEGYTAFMTYMLVNESGSTNGNGYANAIHCNYINKIYFEDLVNKEFNMYFDNIDEFKFLSTSGGTGFTAQKFVALTQLIDNSTYESVDDVVPIPDQWVAFDVTDEVRDYIPGELLSPEQLTTVVFRIPIAQYNLKKNNKDFYTLDYLSYPSKSGSGLSFGDETYFMGNVTAGVEAIAHTMDLAINLPLNQFNSSNNETWDSELDKQVYISEIGVYDGNKNLVGIAKLNNPIPKDDTISRTIVFAMDF